MNQVCSRNYYIITLNCRSKHSSCKSSTSHQSALLAYLENLLSFVASYICPHNLLSWVTLLTWRTIKYQRCKKKARADTIAHPLHIRKTQSEAQCHVCFDSRWHVEVWWERATLTDVQEESLGSIREQCKVTFFCSNIAHATLGINQFAWCGTWLYSS